MPAPWLAVNFRGWHTPGGSRLRGMLLHAKTALKKNQNALVFVDLRVQGKRYAGQKRYKTKKSGTLSEPMFAFVI